jgi:hypothetical protein
MPHILSPEVTTGPRHRLKRAPVTNNAAGISDLPPTVEVRPSRPIITYLSEESPHRAKMGSLRTRNDTSRRCAGRCMRRVSHSADITRIELVLSRVPRERSDGDA